MKERLQKLIASAGLCARRTAEDWIAAGRVCVNGAVASLGDRADLPSRWMARRCQESRGRSI